MFEHNVYLSTFSRPLHRFITLRNDKFPKGKRCQNVGKGLKKFLY